MKLDAVFFNLIPGVNRDVARLDLQLAFASEACQYALMSSEHAFCSILKDAQPQESGERSFAAVLSFSGMFSLIISLRAPPIHLPIFFYFSRNPSLLSFVMTLKAGSGTLYSFLLTKVGRNRLFLSFPFCHLKYIMSFKAY